MPSNNVLSAVTEIDIDLGRQNLNIVPAMQYDTARTIRARLFDNGIAWSVPDSNVLAVVGYKKDDNISGFYDKTEANISAIVVDDINRNVITIHLDRNLLATPGLVYVDISFYATQNNYNVRLTSFPFKIDVQPASLSQLDLRNNPYFDVLAGNIARVLAAEQNLAGLTIEQPVITGEPGTNANVVVHGGENTPYSLQFTIPRGNVGPNSEPTTTDYEYANSSSGTVVPSANEWGTSPNPQASTYFWVKSNVHWNNGQVSSIYSVNYISPGNVGSVNGMTGAVVDTLLLTVNSFDQLPQTFSNEMITSDFQVAQYRLSNPRAQNGEWTVTTSNGSLTISGSMIDGQSTDLKLLLVRPVTISNVTV